MKPEKKIIVADLLNKIHNSPFLLVIDYKGMTVPQFAVLRGKLAESGAECHVTKNTYVRIAAKEAEYPGDLAEHLSGPTAVVTGTQDIAAALKSLKEFTKGTNKGVVRAGILDNRLILADDIQAIIDLPPREVVLAQLLGLMKEPATQLARVINEPGTQFARLLKAISEKED